MTSILHWEATDRVYCCVRVNRILLTVAQSGAQRTLYTPFENHGSVLGAEVWYQYLIIMSGKDFLEYGGNGFLLKRNATLLRAILHGK